MNKLDKIRAIEDFKEKYTNISKIVSKMDEFFGCVIEGDLIKTVWEMVDVCVDNMSKSLDISLDDLNWFIYDNNFGENGFCVECGGVYTITDIKTFVEYTEDIN